MERRNQHFLDIELGVRPAVVELRGEHARLHFQRSSAGPGHLHMVDYPSRCESQRFQFCGELSYDGISCSHRLRDLSESNAGGFRHDKHRCCSLARDRPLCECHRRRGGLGHMEWSNDKHELRGAGTAGFIAGGSESIHDSVIRWLVEKQSVRVMLYSKKSLLMLNFVFMFVCFYSLRYLSVFFHPAGPRLQQRCLGSRVAGVSCKHSSPDAYLPLLQFGPVPYHCDRERHSRPRAVHTDINIRNSFDLLHLRVPPQRPLRFPFDTPAPVRIEQSGHAARRLRSVHLRVRHHERTAHESQLPERVTSDFSCIRSGRCCLQHFRRGDFTPDDSDTNKVDAGVTAVLEWRCFRCFGAVRSDAGHVVGTRLPLEYATTLDADWELHLDLSGGGIGLSTAVRMCAARSPTLPVQVPVLHRRNPATGVFARPTRMLWTGRMYLLTEARLNARGRRERRFWERTSTGDRVDCDTSSCCILLPRPTPGSTLSSHPCKSSISLRAVKYLPVTYSLWLL